jgi:hypothetical protein
MIVAGLCDNTTHQLNEQNKYKKGFQFLAQGLFEILAQGLKRSRKK